jgi:hypothetical protein
MVKVYSNCATAELFLNGKSCGVKTRQSQDFPAAGLRWLVPFQPGETISAWPPTRALSKLPTKSASKYQIEMWDQPAAFALEETARAGNVVTLLARPLRARGVPCLDAHNVVRFSVAGDGELLQNLGTSTGARQFGVVSRPGSSQRPSHRRQGRHPRLRRRCCLGIPHHMTTASHRLAVFALAAASLAAAIPRCHNSQEPGTAAFGARVLALDTLPRAWLSGHAAGNRRPVRGPE